MLRTSAQVPELVDGLDLGSSVLWAWGFDSPPGHQRLMRRDASSSCHDGLSADFVPLSVAA